MKTAQSRYVAQVLGHSVKLPGTLRRVLRQDRRTALALCRRGVHINIGQDAFVLALARRV